jgi:hypothetical protein
MRINRFQISKLALPLPVMPCLPALVQVDALEYRLLSDPFPLLTLDIAGAVGDALERINKIRDEAKAAAGADDTKLDSRTSGLQQQHLGKGFQECHDAVCQGAGQQGSSHSDTSAQGMALEEVQQQQQQQEEPLITLPPSALKRLLLKQRPQRALPGAAQWRGRVTARAREGGHLHAVVTWVEAELSPGVVISCAPRQVQGHSKETIDLQDHHVNGHSSKACCKESSDGVKAVGEGGAAPPAASSGVQPQMPSPHLSPHVWQMVHFIPVPVTLSPGQVGVILSSPAALGCWPWVCSGDTSSLGLAPGHGTGTCWIVQPLQQTACPASGLHPAMHTNTSSHARFC